MPAFADRIRAQVLTAQIGLFNCAARMQADTDVEALHDLRINLRRLRSLLKPLRGLHACDELQAQAARLGQLTGPLRDIEVLAGELDTKHQPQSAQARRLRVGAGYSDVLHSQHIAGLWNALDDWPQQWQQAHAEGLLRAAKRKLKKRLLKAQTRLLEALADPLYDWHQLRLLIKRVRYNAEAYPDVAPLSSNSQKALKRAQSALGNWHDLLQWLALAEVESDLQPCVVRWHGELQAAQTLAGVALAALSLALISA